MKLNLGCGPYKADGYVNIDKNPQQHPDLECDLRGGIPFANDTIKEVRAWHFLEHFDNDPLLDLIAEAYRVLQPGGLFDIAVPLGVTGCLDHCMIFTDFSFDQLCRDGGSYFNRTFSWKEVSRSIEDLGWAKVLHIILRAEK